MTAKEEIEINKIKQVISTLVEKHNLPTPDMILPIGNEEHVAKWAFKNWKLYCAILPASDKLIASLFVTNASLSEHYYEAKDLSLTGDEDITKLAAYINSFKDKLS